MTSSPHTERLHQLRKSAGGFAAQQHWLLDARAVATGRHDGGFDEARAGGKDDLFRSPAFSAGETEFRSGPLDMAEVSEMEPSAIGGFFALEQVTVENTDLSRVRQFSVRREKRHPCSARAFRRLATGVEYQKQKSARGPRILDRLRYWTPRFAKPTKPTLISAVHRFISRPLYSKLINVSDTRVQPALPRSP